MRVAGAGAELDGMRLAAGTQLLVPVYAVHHDPTYYPAPHRFDPERFSPEQVASRPDKAYLPFGLGPRHCVGEK